MARTASALVAIEDSWAAIPIVESPARSNRTPIGQEYGLNGVAWCCETQCVALARIGLPVMHTAGVADAMARAQRGENGMRWIGKNDTIRKGDMPCYDWKGHRNPQDMHIACVRDPGTQAKFQTVAGNENDRVMIQWRDRTYVMGFIRPPYDPEGSTPSPQEDDLTGPEHEMLTQIHDAVADIESRVANVIQRELEAFKTEFEQRFPPPTQPQNP